MSPRNTAVLPEPVWEVRADSLKSFSSCITVSCPGYICGKGKLPCFGIRVGSLDWEYNDVIAAKSLE